MEQVLSVVSWCMNYAKGITKRRIYANPGQTETGYARKAVYLVNVNIINFFMEVRNDSW
ncbi:MAG: hypothetical protein GX235_07425 [Clostridiales bacterium]|nr:hypothetical protein [Clostridiales bacterium]